MRLVGLFFGLNLEWGLRPNIGGPNSENTDIYWLCAICQENRPSGTITAEEKPAHHFRLAGGFSGFNLGLALTARLNLISAEKTYHFLCHNVIPIIATKAPNALSVLAFYRMYSVKN